MELVYLWVEDYKNIKKQGFNFSPRFVCKFHDKYEKDEDGKEKLKDNCELEINPKEYTSIFPDNINITAIVGENGSGKSSLLNAITNKGIVIYKNKTFFVKGKYKLVNKEQVDLDFDKEFLIIHTNSDLMKINHIKNAWDAYRLNMYDENVYIPKDDSPIFTNKINIKAFEIRIIKLINKHIKYFQNNLFHFNPTSVKVSFSPFVMPVDIVKKKDSNKKYIYTRNERKILYSIGAEMLNIRDIGKNIYEKLLSFFFTKNAFIAGKLSEKLLDIKNIMGMDKLELEDYTTLLSKEDISIAKKLFKFLEEKNVFDCSFTINNFFDNLEKIECTNIFFKLIEIDFLRINFIDKEKEMIKYFDLSQGERKFFNEFLMIFDKVKETDKKDIVIALDEPDLSLHPEWQKKYLQNLLKLLEEFPKKKFHIIITSHSPFILSDLPKENVIFLKDGKQEYPFENKQTFGANIHTLLSDGFFMSDGLMGEFAKGKIEEIKKFYELVEKFKDRIKNNERSKRIVKKAFKKRKKRFEHIQSIIGEPFLQTIMKNYLDELEIYFNGKNKFLDKEIKRLQALKDK